jgi:hypothetical protein
MCFRVLLVAGVLLALTAHASETCGLREVFRFRPAQGPTRTVRSGDGALAYTARLEVDVDGAPNAYHPDDRAGGALDTLCNAGTAVLPDGSRISGDEDCARFLAAYRSARAAGWTDASKPRIEWVGLATRDSERFVPCVQDEGPYRGFFVGQTHLTADATAAVCAPARYLDATRVPFFVLPTGSRFVTDLGMKLGDLGVAYYPETGRIVAAVFGDTGPPTKLGEGSLALAWAVRGEKLDAPAQPGAAEAATIEDSDGVFIVLFPASSPGPPFTAERIARAGAERLERWGGRARVLACADAASR